MKKAKRVIALLLVLCMALCFGLTACGGNDAGASGAAPEASSDTAQTDMATAPEIKGLTFESELERDYATQYNVFRYEGGYKYFHIVDGDDFLLVPEDGEVPEDLPEDVTVLQAPVENIYLAATAQMALFISMDGQDAIRMTSLKADGWTFDEPKELMEAGDIVFAGKYSEPDYEMLLDEGCQLAIESTMIYHTPEVQEMIEELGIPVLVDRSSYESNPLGRMEWIKFYAEMIGKEDEAKAFFDEQKAKIEGLEDFENTEKTVAFFYISTDGKAMVRKGTDYIPAMIEMAGARYIFKDFDDGSGKQTMPMSIEAFYDTAKEADYIVYNGSIDSSVKTLDDLKAKDPVIAEMKAVKEDNCWLAGGAIYQRTDIAGDMIMDFHTLFTSDDPEAELTYITKLK